MNKLFTVEQVEAALDAKRKLFVASVSGNISPEEAKILREYSDTISNVLLDLKFYLKNNQE
jgi:hypothetical protein